ncbi:MAG: hypothetical protein Q9182_005485 [Xanthomendoza sp. 2 TL-2023]
MAASILHTISHSYPPPPSFSQETTESSINGARLPQPGMQSFDPVQSIPSTPTPTPPASRAQHHIPPFNTTAYPSTNGVPIQQAPPKPYPEANGVIPQQQYPPGHNPSIYTAVYSSVSVYEMEVNRIAVMRRRSDSWLNATQILKVAGIDKAKRTKVLEKEILNGEHEKVQGGYGKYQGTWINYHRGVAFCRQYGVAEILRPLLEYDMGQDGTTLAGRGNINTPTKEQAMAAQRKKALINGSLDARSSPQSQGGTFFSNISKTAATAVNAINKARFDPGGSRSISNSRPAPQGRRPSQQLISSQDSAMGPNSQQSMHSDASFATNTHIDPALRSANPGFVEIDAIGDTEPPRKRQKPSSSQTQGYQDVSMMNFAPGEGDAFFLSPNPQSTMTHVNGLPALPPPVSYETNNKKTMLLSLFEDPDRTDFANHPAILRLSGEDFDIPMDGTAHTALHWAASLGRIDLLRTLVSKGASIYRLNSGGETALMRAANTTNNYMNGTFPEVLKLLGTSIEIRDGRGQTVLHHIATSSGIEGRPQAMRTYLDSMLLYVVGNSNAPNSQQASFAADDDNIAGVRPIGLARFMSDIVNSRDMAGDTALHLAAKNCNRNIVQQLLEIGADPTIANRRGLKPIDIPGVGGDPNSSHLRSSSQLAKDDDKSVNQFQEAHDALLESVQTQLSDAKHNFESERKKKQVLIDAAHASLRENASQLALERQRLDELKRKANESKTLRLKVTNLRRATDVLQSRLETRPDLKTNIKIGEADAGLEVEISKLPSSTQPHSSPSNPSSAAAASIPHNEYLDYLPPTSILQARTEAYRANNEQLELQIQALNDQSTELEEQLKTVVQVCTRVEDPGVLEEMLPRLLAAVQSEGGEELEVGRLAELLRRVEEEGGE